MHYSVHRAVKLATFPVDFKVAVFIICRMFVCYFRSYDTWTYCIKYVLAEPLNHSIIGVVVSFHFGFRESKLNCNFWLKTLSRAVNNKPKATQPFFLELWRGGRRKHRGRTVACGVATPWYPSYHQNNYNNSIVPPNSSDSPLYASYYKGSFFVLSQISVLNYNTEDFV
jgi:hypothetical protein